jgi:hypothetical protein
MQRYTVYIWKLLYMFRVVLSSIIRSAYTCIYSIWYLSHRYCYLPLSWKTWNRFECAVGGVRRTDISEEICVLVARGIVSYKSIIRKIIVVYFLKQLVGRIVELFDLKSCRLYNCYCLLNDQV